MIPLMRNTFLHDAETRAALAAWLIASPDRLSMGPLCAEFERQFAAWQDRKYAVLFNSGGSANLALLSSMQQLGRLPVGSHVGFSALTWATNVAPIIQTNCIPVPFDINPLTLNIDSSVPVLKKLESVKALFVTNALGFLPDYAFWRHFCEQNQIYLLEDNCESLGSALVGVKAGNFGLASTFSFFVAHHMSTIEGGMVCTDDADLAMMLVMVRANGWDRNLTAPQQAKWRQQYEIRDEMQAKYTFYVPGYNMRPTEITGFLGLQQLKYLDENISARADIYAELEAVVMTNPDLILLDHSHQLTFSPFCFPVLCRTPELRTKYAARFAGAGVEIRPVIAGNITRQPFYRDYRSSAGPLPGADMVSECGMYAGLYPELTRADIETLKSCVGNW